MLVRFFFWRSTFVLFSSLVEKVTKIVRAGGRSYDFFYNFRLHKEKGTNADRRKKSYEQPPARTIFYFRLNKKIEQTLIARKNRYIEPPLYEFFCNLLSTGSHEDCSTLADLAKALTSMPVRFPNRAHHGALLANMGWAL